MKSVDGKRVVGVLDVGGVVGVVAVLALVASWVSVPTVTTVGSGAQTQPGLMIMRADRLPVVGGVREQIWLLDPGPLFMPDGASIGQGGVKGLQSRSGGQAEKSYPAALNFPDEQPTGGLLRPPTIRTPAEAAAKLAEPRWFEGMSRSQTVEVAAGGALKRAARFELFQLGQPGAVAAYDLQTDEVLSAVSWKPLELSLTILDSNVLTRPVVVTSSGNERVDDRVRALAGRELLLKTRLRPGIYRLEVGP